MSTKQNEDEQEKQSLVSAAEGLVKALEEKVSGNPLRFKIKFDPFQSNTDGWGVCIGTMGAELPRLELYYDRINGGKKRLFWVGFSAKKLEITGKASDACKLPIVSRQISDTDLNKGRSGHLKLKRPMNANMFKKPVVELYNTEGFFYFGVYDKPGSPFNSDLGRDFFVPIIKALRKKDSGEVELASYGFIRRLKRDRQSKFRTNILQAYNGMCAVTGCDVSQCVEAAHIDRFSNTFDNSVTNGVLLRADLHRLMDEGLMTFIWSEREIKAQISSIVKNDEYRRMHNKPLRLPSDETSHPSRAFIQLHASKAKRLNVL